MAEMKSREFKIDMKDTGPPSKLSAPTVNMGAAKSGRPASLMASAKQAVNERKRLSPQSNH